jgi:hypothetical protein
MGEKNEKIRIFEIGCWIWMNKKQQLRPKTLSHQGVLKLKVHF